MRPSLFTLLRLEHPGARDIVVPPGVEEYITRKTPGVFYAFRRTSSRSGIAPPNQRAWSV
jgi:hypothetical protein